MSATTTRIEVPRLTHWWEPLLGALVVLCAPAILTGLVIPIFQKNVAEAQRAKLMEDIDTLRNAITLHDSQNRPLTGLFTATGCVRLLCHRGAIDVRDPWGRDIQVDATAGAIVSYGKDGRPGGSGEDEDVVVRYKGPPRVRSTEYRGPPGYPAIGSTLQVVFGKAVRVVADPVRDLALVLHRKQGVVLPLDGGWARIENRLPGESLAAAASLGGARWIYAPELSDLPAGRVVLKCMEAPSTRDPRVVRFGPATEVDVRASVVAGDDTSLAAIREACELDVVKAAGAFPSL